MMIQSSKERFGLETALTNVLILEDEAGDAKLIKLKLGGESERYAFRWVATRKEFIRALEEFRPAIILADFTLPAYDGLTALRDARRRLPDIPVIMVTGNLGEETAVEVLKKGATDYVLKSNLARLPSAVERALEEAGERAERQRVQEELRRSARALRVLSQVNQVLVRATEEDSFLREICQAIAKLGKYRLAWVGEAMRDSGKTVRPLAYAGEGKGYLKDIRVSWDDNELGRGPTGIAIRSGKPYIARNVRNKAAFASWREAATRRGFNSSIALPLFKQDEVFGALNIYAAERDAFDRKEAGLLMELASDVSFGLASLSERAERARSQQKLGQSMEQLRAAIAGAVQAIALTVESRDPYTAGHQQRVADLAQAIAVEMCLPARQIDGISMAGAIHNLGKIHVPAEILSKPVKLTRAEMEIMRSHPQISYEILKTIEFPWPIADIVLQHHERMDGSGYPNGFSGNDILLEARVLAVADVVEAMSSHRPYRPALGEQLALMELSRGRGRLFDEYVIDSCLRLFTENRYFFKDKILTQML